ncbi:M13 family metallopeptidase [Butyrivibrio sp. AE3004]|uniref:M13 family metallopeptidase n=1 Tax=Butyrivibrio sp. AE3004 TaxID=1506994 RepID=UPI000493F710|nr:M13 family metallopeptidase [Butyrivibrio sp. AE3004]
MVRNTNLLKRTGKKVIASVCVASILFGMTVSAADRPGAKWMDSGIFGVFKDAPEIRPQDDFAAYVNRKWAEKVKIAEGESNASSRTEQTERVNEAKIKVITGEKKDDKNLTSVQNLYNLLLDWDSRDKNEYKVLKKYTDDILSISSIDELTEFYSDKERNLLMGPNVEDIVTANEMDALSNIFVLLTPKMVGPRAEYYDGADKGNDSDLIKVVRQSSEYVLERAGYDKKQAKELTDSCINFELKLAPAKRSMEKKEQEMGPEALATVLTSKELEERYKNIPFIDIYKKLGYDLKDSSVRIYYVDMIDEYDKLYTEENLEELKAWTLVHTIIDISDYLDRDTYEAMAKFSEPMTGTDSVKDDQAYAMETIQKLAKYQIDEVYANYCFDQDIKPQVMELTKMMVDEYREMLQAEDWLSDETKKLAIEKLDNIKLNVCYPDKFLDAGTLDIKSSDEGETVLDAVAEAKQYALGRKIKLLTIKNDGTYWSDLENCSELGAAYEPAENSLNIMAAICGGDYYDPDWPLEKKLGGLCMIVGHEISHAFDTKGANYDKDGNLADWWQPEDKAEFKKRVAKLNKYYAALVPAPEISDEPYGEEGAIHVNGEAIADLGSLKCLLGIAKKQKNFDYEMFFTQIATIQKNARYDAAEQFYIATESHPVECYRCNIPVQNYDEFLETYDVKEGDGMYLAPEDRITVW